MKALPLPKDRKQPTRATWAALGRLAQELLRKPTMEELIRQGYRHCFNPELLRQLREIALNNWDEVGPRVPERCKVQIDISQKVWWDTIVSTEISDEERHRILFWFLPAVIGAAAFVKAGGFKNPPGAQIELRRFIQYALARKECMVDLISSSRPDSHIRWLYFNDMFPRYTSNIEESRLNRAISEARRNGEIIILGTRLERAEKCLHDLADVFVSYPQSNVMPSECEPFYHALNELMPYIDSSEAVEKPPSAEEKQPQLKFDEGARVVRWNDRIIKINAGSHFAVLRRLWDAKGSLVSYGELLGLVKPKAVVRGFPERTVPPEVREAVARIRSALRKAGCPFEITTAQRMGYRMSSNNN